MEKKGQPNNLELLELLQKNMEHKFFMRADGGPIYVTRLGLPDDKLKMPIHEHIIPELKKAGYFKPDDEVLGGYLRGHATGGVVELMYWGESSYPVKAATRKQFDEAVANSRPLVLFDWPLPVKAKV